MIVNPESENFLNANERILEIPVAIGERDVSDLLTQLTSWYTEPGSGHVLLRVSILENNLKLVEQGR